MAVSDRYNLVILPVSGADSGVRRFLLSASRADRQQRMISGEWTGEQVREALARVDVSRLQVEELFRGNRMAFGPREDRFLFFTAEQLGVMGLTLAAVVDPIITMEP